MHDRSCDGDRVQLLDLHQARLHFTFIAPERFQLRAGGDNLSEYLFNKHAIHHQSCNDCGVEVFARGRKADGTAVVALNVSCIDGVNFQSSR